MMVARSMNLSNGSGSVDGEGRGLEWVEGLSD